MLSALWLIVAPPLASAVLLVLVGRRLGRAAVAILGVGSVAAAAAITLAAGVEFLTSPNTLAASETLWTFLPLGDQGLQVDFGLRLDGLSLVMCLVITWVGALIHLYAAGYMQSDPDFARFFASMNLFVAAMLVLVLADDFAFLFLGWEGVGLCSFLLIGFWYREEKNAAAARKAFLVTRIGDTALIIGLLMIFREVQTLSIQSTLALAPERFSPEIALTVALLILGGAVGKSAQLPLQVWLPDAMAGPTPVSALIHAATMVTAGFYLIARCHGLFLLAPQAMEIVAWVGVLTIVLGGLSALTQRDIKRVLAYSTISQIGIMFVALGVGAWSAAVFHFLTHALFKALLFLGAGAVIVALHHEQDLFRMGGLRKRLPLVFWTFLIGAASLAAVPYVTSGFYSKDAILGQCLNAPSGGPWLFGLFLFGALLTALYTGRMLGLAFFGPVQTEPSVPLGLRMQIPLVVLAALATVAGFLELPPNLGSHRLLSLLLDPILPAQPESGAGLLAEWLLQGLSGAISLGGLCAAIAWTRAPARRRGPSKGALFRAFAAGLGFDWLYDRLLVRPFRTLADWNRDDVFDGLQRLVAGCSRLLHSGLALGQTGRVRHYLAWLSAGAALALLLRLVLP